MMMRAVAGSSHSMFPVATRSFRSSAALRAVGAKIPSVSIDFGFPPEKVDMVARTAGKNTVPEYLEKQDALKAAGVDEVLVYCVNDGAVMSAWAADQGVEGSMVTFLADTRRELTEALGMTMTHPGPLNDLGNLRCKRFALYLVDGVIKVESVSEGPDDPAGGDDPSASCVDAMLEKIKSL